MKTRVLKLEVDLLEKTKVMKFRNHHVERFEYQIRKLTVYNLCFKGEVVTERVLRVAGENMMSLHPPSAERFL